MRRLQKILSASLGTVLFMTLSLFSIRIQDTHKTIRVNGNWATDMQIHIHYWWFLRGHWKAVITADADNSLPEDSTREYIYRDKSPMFYKQQDWMLIIYCRTPAAVPKHFGSRLTVEQVAISDQEITRLLTANAYEKEGMTLETY